MLTHSARAAAKQLNKAPLVAARGAREVLWLERLTMPLGIERAGQYFTNLQRVAFTKSIAYKLSRDFSFSSFLGGECLEDLALTKALRARGG